MLASSAASARSTSASASSPLPSTKLCTVSAPTPRCSRRASCSNRRGATTTCGRIPPQATRTASSAALSSGSATATDMTSGSSALSPSLSGNARAAAHTRSGTLVNQCGSGASSAGVVAKRRTSTELSAVATATSSLTSNKASAIAVPFCTRVATAARLVASSASSSHRRFSKVGRGRGDEIIVDLRGSAWDEVIPTNEMVHRWCTIS